MKQTKTPVFIVILLFTAGLLIKTETITKAVGEGLGLCVSAVIPALFPFFVVSGLMINTGMVSLFGKFLSPISSKLFKTSGKGAVVFVIGLLCGYPTGAKVVAELYREGSIQKEEATRLLAFCNNSGPLFVIGTVGAVMLGNTLVGVTLYVIHAISAVICGLILGLFSKKENTFQKEEIIAETLGEAIAKSVERAVVSILNVCGYVVFFACVTSLIKPYISDCFLLSLIEVTAGAKGIVASGLPSQSILVLLSGAIGFGGLCVLFQVQGAVASAGLSVKTYFFGKALQMLVSMVLMKAYLVLNRDVAVFGNLSKLRENFNAPYVLLFAFLMCGIFTIRRLTKKN